MKLYLIEVYRFASVHSALRFGFEPTAWLHFINSGTASPFYGSPPAAGAISLISSVHWDGVQHVLEYASFELLATSSTLIGDTTPSTIRTDPSVWARVLGGTAILSFDLADFEEFGK